MEDNNTNPKNYRWLRIISWTVLMAVVSWLWWTYTGEEQGGGSYLLLFLGALWLGFSIIIYKPKSPEILPAFKMDNTFNK